MVDVVHFQPTSYDLRIVVKMAQKFIVVKMDSELGLFQRAMRSSASGCNVRGAPLGIVDSQLTSGYSNLKTVSDITSDLKIELNSIRIHAAMRPNVSMNLIRMEITLPFSHGKLQHFEHPVQRPPDLRSSRG